MTRVTSLPRSLRRLAWAILLLALPGTATAQDITQLRLGTGGKAGTYYALGQIIGQSVTLQSLQEECTGGDCPPRLMVVPQTSNGSVANVRALSRGQLELAFAQSNILHWSYSAEGLYEGETPRAELRVIANLYPETLHLVVDADSPIRQLRDIVGHRISLDEPGSGTLLDAGLVLDAMDISRESFQAEYIKPDLAVERIERGNLDGFFIVAGAPVAGLDPGSFNRSFRLVPIEGAEIDALIDRHAFYTRAVIPADAYQGAPATNTLAVGAHLVTHSRISEEQVYRFTELLWREATGRALAAGHSQGRAIRMEDALQGISIPLHPGAERFYRDVELLSLRQ